MLVPSLFEDVELMFITDRKPGRGRNVVGYGKKWEEGAKRREEMGEGGR